MYIVVYNSTQTTLHRRTEPVTVVAVATRSIHNCTAKLHNKIFHYRGRPIRPPASDRSNGEI